MTKRLLLIFVSACFLLSCSEKKDPLDGKPVDDVNNCPSTSVVSLYFVNESFREIFLDSNFNQVDTTQYLNDILQITLLLQLTSEKLIDQAGGFNPNNDIPELMDPCNKGSLSVGIFREIDLNNQVSEMLNKLIADSNNYNEKEQALIKRITGFSLIYFDITKPYFSNNRVNKTQYSQLALDLLVIENGIYRYILM